MSNQKKTESAITLLDWLIDRIDTPKWRIGAVTGYKHPEITQKEIDRIGKQSLMEQAQDLERRGLIKVKRREWGNDIERLDVSVDVMGELCHLAGRIDPREELAAARADIERWREAAPRDWRRSYYDHLLERMAEGVIPAEAGDQLLFQFLNAIPADQTAVWKRIFSSAVAGHSKIFKDRYEDRILAIIRKYATGIEKEMEDQALLAELGILSYSQTLELKGPLCYRIPGGGEIQAKDQIFGAVLNAQTLTVAEPVSLDGIKRVIVIENKANYEDAAFDSEILYIYCHGFFSQKEREFLQKVYRLAGADVLYFHWGDMDYGGIRIFHFVKERLFPELHPLYMDRIQFESALSAGAGIKLEEEKRKKLEAMDAGELEDLKQCILSAGAEIEQETLLARKYLEKQY